MPNIITLKCKNCSGNLNISPEMDTFACGFCGVNQMVERKGGTIALKFVTDAISKVQIGTDKTAAELAIQRLKSEVEESNKKYSKVLKKRNDEFKDILVVYFVIFIFVSIFLLYPAFNSRYGVILNILWLAVSGGMAFTFYKHHNSFEKEHKPKIDNAAMELKSLRTKLEEQRKIADS